MFKFIFIGLMTIFSTCFGMASEKLILTGSSTVAPLLSEIAKRFETTHKGIRVDVQTGGSSRGITDARQGTADIGMVSRALKGGEKDLKSFTVAMDGIGLIVHSSNNIKSLTNEQIVKIFKGRIKNWKEVGGSDRTITVVNKAEGRSTLELFLDYFNLTSPEVKASVIIGDNEQGIKIVSENPNSIGYVSIGAAEYSISEGIKLKLLPMNGVSASTKNVRLGKFPLSRPLNLVVAGEVTDLKKEFLDFAQSKSVKDLIKDQYFVSLEN